ncbi:hypothetical protein [Nocardia farcinica]
MSTADEITRILAAAETLFVNASELVLSNPLKAQDQIARGIETMHSVRGFLL